MTQNAEIINSFFKKVKSSLFPIEKHPLENSEEYAKEIYITMLYTVAGLDVSIAEDKKNFIERLTTGVGLGGGSSKYIKRALNIDEETLSEFLKLFSGEELAYNFFVDSIVMLGCCGDISEKSIEIVSEYAEVLKLDKEEVKSLTHISIIILERNSIEYFKWLEEKSDKIKTKDLLYYIREFATGRIIKEKDYEYWFGKFDINQSEVIERKDVEIENAQVTIADDIELRFKSCDNIKIKSSEFRGENGLHMLNNINLYIEDSKFKDFKSRALYIENIMSIGINNSEFKNCSYTTSGIESGCGGAIYIKNIEEMDIKNSEFNDCSVTGNSTNGSSIYMEADESLIQEIQFKNNIFKNCKCYRKHGFNNVLGVWESGGTVHGISFIMNEEKILEENKFQNCNQEISF